ncbi:MAG: cytochrome c [Myxococcota bacterium]
MDRFVRTFLLACVLVACAEQRGEMLSTGSRADTVDMVPDGDPQLDAALEMVQGDRRNQVLVRELLPTAQTIEVEDPNHHRTKRYLAVPLLPVLLSGLELTEEQLAKKTLIFEALDGYASPAPGDVVRQKGAWLAIDDLDGAGWVSIGEKKASPGPLYVVWAGEKRDPKVYPWPWALARVRVASIAEEYADASPGENASELVRQGHTLFLNQCVRCHAINRAGGRLGPELNVPQSIVEYRPEEQIRAYIRNPLTFRYGNMPANPHLGEEDLDALLAYFRVMKDRKLLSR